MTKGRMSDRPLYVIDASVAVKWCLRDEESFAYARSTLLSFRSGAIDLVSAESLRYEVVGAVRKAHRTRRITHEQALTAIESFLRSGIIHVQHDQLIVTAYELSVEIGCSFYGALYVASRLNRPLIHAYHRLSNTLARYDVPTMWLEDWPLDHPSDK